MVKTLILVDFKAFDGLIDGLCGTPVDTKSLTPFLYYGFGNDYVAAHATCFIASKPQQFVLHAFTTTFHECDSTHR